MEVSAIPEVVFGLSSRTAQKSRCGPTRSRLNRYRRIIRHSFLNREFPGNGAFSAPTATWADTTGVARLDVIPFPLPAATGQVELIADQHHFQRVVLEGMLRAQVSLDISTADFKAMLVPARGGSRRAPSIIEHFIKLADRGVEVRLLHAGVPSGAALRELKKRMPPRMVIRRCPRLHAKAVIVDAAAMYLGSANLTGAGLGAKGDDKRNFELGIWTRSPALIDDVLQHFNALWEGERCRTCRRKDVCPVPLEEPRL